MDYCWVFLIIKLTNLSNRITTCQVRLCILYSLWPRMSEKYHNFCLCITMSSLPREYPSRNRTLSMPSLLSEL